MSALCFSSWSFKAVVHNFQSTPTAFATFIACSPWFAGCRCLCSFWGNYIQFFSDSWFSTDSLALVALRGFTRIEVLLVCFKPLFFLVLLMIRCAAILFEEGFLLGLWLGFPCLGTPYVGSIFSLSLGVLTVLVLVSIPPLSLCTGEEDFNCSCSNFISSTLRLSSDTEQLELTMSAKFIKSRSSSADTKG